MGEKNYISLPSTQVCPAAKTREGEVGFLQRFGVNLSYGSFCSQCAEPLSCQGITGILKGTGRAIAEKPWGCLLRFNVFPNEFPKSGVNVGQGT